LEVAIAIISVSVWLGFWFADETGTIQTKKKSIKNGMNRSVTGRRRRESEDNQTYGRASYLRRVATKISSTTALILLRYRQRYVDLIVNPQVRNLPSPRSDNNWDPPVLRTSGLY